MEHFAISIILSIFLNLFQKIDHNCFLCDIVDKFPHWSEAPILPCTPLLSHYCLLSGIYISSYSSQNKAIDQKRIVTLQ